MFSFVGSLCFVFDSYLSVSFVLFLFFVCLLYCLSHHLQGRVHDSDPMGGHDSDSSLGPGIFLPHVGVFFYFILFALWLIFVSPSRENITP